LRLRRDLSQEDPGLSLNQLLRQAEIRWQGVRLNQPDWSDESHSLAAAVESLRGRFLLHLMLNAYWEPLEFELPSPESPGWRRLVDTALDPPHDISEVQAAPVVAGSTYRVQPRSVVLLVSRISGKPGSGAREPRRSKRG
jgi:glycogen operon protein